MGGSGEDWTKISYIAMYDERPKKEIKETISIWNSVELY